VVVYFESYIYTQQQKEEINLLLPTEINISDNSEVVVIYKFPDLNIINLSGQGRISVTFFINLSDFDTIKYIELKGKVSKDSLSALGDYIFDLPWFPIYGTKPDNGIIVSIGDTIKKVGAGEEFSIKKEGLVADISLSKGLNPIVFESCGMSGDKKLNIIYLPNDARVGLKDGKLIIKGKIYSEFIRRHKEDSIVTGAKNDICNSYGTDGKFCSDVVIDAYKNIGIELPIETRNAYKMYLFFKEKGKLLDKNTTWQKGDVIFWDTTSDWSGPQNGKVHVGMYGGLDYGYIGKDSDTAYGKIIFHASSSAIHPVKKTKGHVRGVLLWPESKKDGRIIGIGRW